MYGWWTNILSRLSRSASSLLNQHSPKLEEILDTGTGVSLNPLVVQRSPLEVPLELQSPRDSIPVSRLDKSIVGGGEGDLAASVSRVEISLLKERICAFEYERESLLGGEMQNQQTPLLDVMHNVDAPSTASNEVESIYDIPSVLPILTLRTDQITRYSRQLLLNDGFGIEGQKRLLSLSVLVIGAGGVGSTVLLYLAATGVGHITVVDYDNVEMSNLHQQVIHKDVDAVGVKGMLNGGVVMSS